MKNILTSKLLKFLSRMGKIYIEVSRWSRSKFLAISKYVIHRLILIFCLSAIYLFYLIIARAEEESTAVSRSSVCSHRRKIRPISQILRTNKHRDQCSQGVTKVKQRHLPAILHTIIMVLHRKVLLLRYFICLNIEAEQRAEAI